jgi:hypothetical protein
VTERLLKLYEDEDQNDFRLELHDDGIDGPEAA